MVWVGSLKNRHSSPTIARTTIPKFVATHLTPYSTTASGGPSYSQNHLNNRHNSLRARAFNLIQIKTPVPKSRG
jgi:hypothetical protein